MEIIVGLMAIAFTVMMIVLIFMLLRIFKLQDELTHLRIVEAQREDFEDDYWDDDLED